MEKWKFYYQSFIHIVIINLFILITKNQITLEIRWSSFSFVINTMWEIVRTEGMVRVTYMGWCKKDVATLLMHRSYVFLALTHQYVRNILCIPTRIMFYHGQHRSHQTYPKSSQPSCSVSIIFWQSKKYHSFMNIYLYSRKFTVLKTQACIVIMSFLTAD